MTPMLFLAVICFGCSQTVKKAPLQKALKPVHARNNAPLFQYGNPVLLQYDRYIAGLDTESVEMSGQALDTFQLLFKKQPVAVCDTAFYIFNQYHNKLSYFLNMNTDKDSINYEDFLFPGENNKMPVLSKKQKAIKHKLDQGGFALEAGEGVYITQDQHFLSQYFAKYVSPAMKQYLVQLAKEQKEGFDEEGGLTIDPPVLADRTVWWEQFSRANTNFIYSKRASLTYNLLLYVLMEGESDGAREFHYDSSGLNVDSVKLSDYFKTAWTYMQEKHPQSQATAVVTPYLNAWLKNDTTEAGKILAGFEKEHQSPWEAYYAY
jgi:hypothetical protein